VPYLARLMFTVFFREELPGESFLEYMQRFQLHRHEAYRIYSHLESTEQRRIFVGLLGGSINGGTPKWIVSNGKSY
jgi:hypothetical protein